MDGTRRWFLTTLSVALLAGPLAADAQQTNKVHRIGVLFEYGPLAAMSGPEPSHPHLRPFIQRLRELGYIEGQNLVIERRAAEGHKDRLPALAAELVALKPDIIVAGPILVPRVVQQATSTIPIVAPAMDPAGSFGVESLARPGGNLTGVQQLVDWDIEGKRLEILKVALPGASRVGVLLQAGTRPDSSGVSQQLEKAARALGMTLTAVVIERVEQLEQAFATFARDRIDALYVPAGIISWAHRRELAERTARARVPTMYALSENVHAGGLMAYSVDVFDLFRRAAEYVDKILKGAKPHELPIEQPRRFELVINMKAAKALALTLPPPLLLRADRVID
jgi:putative ABC transport system substrate-binding protein